MIFCHRNCVQDLVINVHFGRFPHKKKEQYVAFKSEHYLEKIKHECPGLDSTLQASDIIDIDVSRYSNMRDINSEIMRQITDALYAQIVK